MHCVGRIRQCPFLTDLRAAGRWWQGAVGAAGASAQAPATAPRPELLAEDGPLRPAFVPQPCCSRGFVAVASVGEGRAGWQLPAALLSGVPAARSCWRSPPSIVPASPRSCCSHSTASKGAEKLAECGSEKQQETGASSHEPPGSDVRSAAQDDAQEGGGRQASSQIYQDWSPREAPLDP